VRPARRAGHTNDVAGFTDEALFGNLNNSWYRVYVTPAAFADLAAAAPDAVGTLISARFSDPDPAVVDRVALDYTLAYHLADPAFGAGGLAPYSYAEARAARTFFPGIMSAILLAFAGLIAVVCLVAVRFRVRTSIEASMADIGVEKAVGYTSGQIAGALLLQFAGVTLAAAAAGVGLSYAVLPAVAGVLEAQSALAWSPGFLPLPALVTVGSLVATVTLVTGLAAGRIRRLAPLTALRSGLATHSFRHNRFPLATTRGPLGGLLAAKQAVQGRGQLAMIGLIGALGAFAATVMLSTYASLAVNPGRLSEALMGELPDAFVGTVTDDGAVAADLAGRDGVTSVFAFDDVQLLVDDAITVGRIVDDPAHLRGTLLTAGRYPSHANELVLGGARAKLWDKHAGDSVTVSVGGRTADYLVTGEMQNLTGFSDAVLLTEAGLHRVMPDFRPDSYYVYLDDPAGSDAFVAEVAQDPRVSQAVDTRALVISQQSVYLDAMLYAAVVVVAVTIALVGLVLYLVLATAIRRRRQAHGIQKAVGFTTGQLIGQIALAYLPAVLVGIGLGAVVGGLATGPAMTVIFRGLGLGLATVDVTANVGLTVALAIGLGLCALATTLAVAARLRQVSAKELIVE